jgi:putative flippase GtrA
LEARLQHNRRFSKLRQLLSRLEIRYPRIVEAGKFAIGSVLGFLDTEIILAVGTLALYGKLSAPRDAYDSPAFIAVNVLAFVIGVTFTFFFDEYLVGTRGGCDIATILGRLVKLQLIFLAGNFVMVAIGLFLLKFFDIPPVLGIIIGGVFSFPMSYFGSMHFVWPVRAERNVTNRVEDKSRNLL